MNDDHRATFVSEAKEHITDLNNALLALEDDPGDESAMDSVFRTAHTLKGNFAAMGFGDTSDLAHALEDLLDEMRAGEIPVTSEVMDIMFQGVDRIEAGVAAIEAGDEDGVETADTVAAIRQTMDDHADAEDGAEADDEAATGDGTASDPGSDDGEFQFGAAAAEFAHADEVPALPDADRVIHGRVTVDTGEMPGVEAMFVLEALSEGFEALELVPSREAIEAGDYEGSFDVFLPDDEPAALSAALETVGAVASFSVTTVRKAGDEGAGAGNVGDGDAPDATDGSAADDDGDSDDADGTGQDEEPSADDIASVRVDVDRLDELHGLVEQLVTNRINIRRALEEESFEDARNGMNDLDKVTSRLQNTVMDMRLIPLRRVVSKLPRVVRDTARESGKEVDFEMNGKDIELDRSILAEIGDPLIHVLRNAVDHGIEPPAEREAAGKPPEGQIELRATRKRDHVTIEVEDDGQGLDADRLRHKAVSEGVITEAEAEEMPDSDVHDLVFHPGLSTNDEVTDLSGRGVGMDVVHRTVEQLDGSVAVESTPGEGTLIQLELPVSVAIVDVLFVAVGDQSYGIPIKNIDEITSDEDIEVAHGNEVVRHGDEVIPVIRLGDALGTADGSDLAADGGETEPATGGTGDGPPDATPAAGAAGPDGLADDGGMLIRIRPSEREVALRCDQVASQEEVVVKPLDGALSGISALSGTAILGDGNIIPILNVGGV